ncbi:hypothetical protein LZP73_17585 [Shewanella sp. AS16]|uniref:hypothetical protein n=1 Tax=Shewanella sp. AS16 TaxID=2907625 RepID=UPI001F2A83EB|nr:hypothetical protein [Shewanella sp. AS16]MCE9687990.1 hypothetical protein [Shewanella sp. AS16]
MLSLLLWPPLLHAQSNNDSFTDHRVRVGLKLFRALLSADLKLKEKTDTSGAVPVILVHINSEDDTREYQALLDNYLREINGLPLRIDIRTLEQILRPGSDKPAAIFIAQKLNDAELSALIEQSINQGVILFSPFEGDVEKGVLAGISVQAAVRPLLNIGTMNQSRLSIKSFYLKAARQYE